MDTFAEHADLIVEVVRATCRANRLEPSSEEEFSAWVFVKLLEGDQAILKKYSGRSSLRSYLAAVCNNLLADWRNVEWGRWRPSAQARRLGPVAIALERRMLRDGEPFDEAVESLVERGEATRSECDRVWPLLPRRPRRQRVSEDVLETVPTDETPESLLREKETELVQERARQQLEDAILRLPDADQLLLRLHYWRGVKLSTLAKSLSEPGSVLYERHSRLLRRLRNVLRAAGVGNGISTP